MGQLGTRDGRADEIVHTGEDLCIWVMTVHMSEILEPVFKLWAQLKFHVYLFTTHTIYWYNEMIYIWALKWIY